MTTTVTENWYDFSAKLPLYHAMHLLEQVPDEDLDRVIRELKKLRKAGGSDE